MERSSCEAGEDVEQQLKPWRSWCLCARSRAWLRLTCDRLHGGSDPVEKNSKPLAAGLADVVSEKE